MENPETDSKCLLLSDLPSSTQHSVMWFNKKGGKISKPNNASCTAELNPNLLQVAINQQIILYDLSELEPREI